ncbi:hypothetical protein [Catenulispora pinisilvae]|uniref:hypothetical protein n=1 Tax=Catenulispora pinisilvae TaxID=2705253 RepID=UPI001890C0E0|nr:hypothetical protein [Catenulispora pinisilvae]
MRVLSRKVATVAAAIGVVGSAAACSSGSGAASLPTPKAGKAAQFSIVDGSGHGVVLAPPGGSFDSIAAMSDGGFVYYDGTTLAAVNSHGIAKTIPFTVAVVSAARGSGADIVVAASGDATVATSATTVVTVNLGSGQATTAFQLPKSGSDANTTPSVFPVGYRPDGSLVVANRDSLWSMAPGGSPSLVGRVPVANGMSSADVYRVAMGNTGTVYAMTDQIGSTRDPLSNRLGSIMTFAAGSTSPVPFALPSAIPGIAGSPKTLQVDGMTSDGGDGIYALVEESPTGSGQRGRTYVVHLHDGQAQIVASEVAGSAHTQAACKLSGEVDASALPCLPSDGTAMAYHAGKLILVGQSTDYKPDYLVIGVG